MYGFLSENFGSKGQKLHNRSLLCSGLRPTVRRFGSIFCTDIVVLCIFFAFFWHETRLRKHAPASKVNAKFFCGVDF